MKKLMLFAAVAVFGLTNVNAQAQFGVTGGFTNISLTASYDGDSASSSEAGFYVGGLADITISEKFHVQPEVLYANAGELSFLQIPVLAKFMVSEDFGILAGPQANLVLDDLPTDVNSFGIDLSFGADYNLNENFFIEARYSLELTNRIKNDGDYKFRFNTLHVGVGYKF